MRSGGQRRGNNVKSPGIPPDKHGLVTAQYKLPCECGSDARGGAGDDDQRGAGRSRLHGVIMSWGRLFPLGEPQHPR